MKNYPDIEETNWEWDIFEYSNLILNVVVSRLWIFLIAGLVGVPLAWIAAKSSPKKFQAEAIILTQPANQGGGGSGTDVARENSVEQLRVLEAWLKSEHVFSSLFPDLLDGAIPTDPQERAVAMDRMRDALEFELVGRSVIRARFSDKKAEGLGRKLEVVLTKLVSGLMEPGSGILTAPQLIAAHQTEMLSSTSDRLLLLIKEAGLEDSQDLRGELAEFAAAKREYNRALARTRRQGETNDKSSSRPTFDPTSTKLADIKRRLDESRAKFGLDASTLDRLSAVADRHATAQSLVSNLADAGVSDNNYIGIFASPERLTIVGRPKDPVLSTSSRLKIAFAVVMLAMLIALGAVLLLELRDNRLKRRAQFEAINGLRVISRVPGTT